MNQNELQHYGIKGMKWGRRKARVESSTDVRRRSSKQQVSDSRTTDNGGTKQKFKIKTKAQKQKEIINKDLKSMSDTELRNRINRMQMEQQYTKMMTPEKSAGRKQVEQLLANEARNLASQMLRDQIKKSMQQGK